MFDLDSIRDQILQNCAISDSQNSGLYSICGLALQLRDLYKWEKGLDPWVEEDSAKVLTWIGEKEDTFNSLPAMLRKRGTGVMTMKAFAGDWLVRPFTVISRNFVNDSEIRFTQAALKYVFTTIDADCTLTGMYSLDHLYENIHAAYYPEMSDEESELLIKIREVARHQAKVWLPDHYQWLENWAAKPDIEADIKST